MDSTCYKCGAAIHDGTAFCPACGAPQIRVTPPESSSAESPAFAPGTPAEMQPPSQPVPLGSFQIPRSDSGIQWRRTIGPIVSGALVVAFGPMLPLGFLWTIAVVTGGGAIAVGLYHRRHISAQPITGNMGAKLGTVTGAVGYVVFSILAVASFTVSGNELRAQVLKRFEQMQKQASDPQAQQMMQEVAQKINTPEGWALMFTLALAMFFFVFVGFSALGGVIGASLTRRSDAKR